MKKFNFIFCMVLFALFATFAGSFKTQELKAEDGIISITSTASFVTELSKDTTGKTYVLDADLNFSSYDCSVFPLDTFKGTLQGNGYEISNISITNSDTGEYGIFKSLSHAKIEDVKFRGISVLATTVNTIVKAGVIAGSSDSSKISNCAITTFVNGPNITNSTVAAQSTATEFIGLVCGEVIDGSEIKNIRGEGMINATQTGINSSKEFYIGGLVGKLFSSTITNSICETTITTSIENSNNTSIGGLVGIVDGNKTLITNTLNQVDVDQTGEVSFLGGVIGRVAISTDMPSSNSILNTYTTSALSSIGNIEELSASNPNFAYKAYNNISLSTVMTNSFYSSSENWNTLYEWDFATIWQIDEKLSLPYLQRFESFSFSFSEDNSFVSIPKPSLDSSVIILKFHNDDYAYEYGGTIGLEANITTENNLNKFFEIVGLQKGSELIYSNIDTLNIIEKGQKIEEEGNTKYTYGSQTLRVFVSGNTTTYVIEGNNIIWSTVDTDGSFSHKYQIENCNLSDEGIYSFALRSLNYTLTVKTENPDYGTVRRSSADSSSKNEVIEETITYGQTLQYFATPSSDYAFSAWTLGIPTNGEAAVAVENKQTFSKIFNEQLFLDGGLFEDYMIGEDSLELYATFTKNVCEIVFKFGINGEISNENISQIYVDNKLVQANENGEISLKVKLGSVHQIRVILASGYDFGGWFESNGTSNIGDLSDAEEMTITASSEEGSKIIVANFLKDVPKEKGDNSWVGFVVGGSIALVVLGIVIFILVRKKKDSSYKNYY